MTLAELGWTDFFANAYVEVADEKWVLGRLIRETKINFSAFLVSFVLNTPPLLSLFGLLESMVFIKFQTLFFAFS